MSAMSDLDYRERLNGPDPDELEQRNAETERQARWEAFTAAVCDFADAESWPAVLSAIGQAWREFEQQRAELVDRR